MKFFQTMIFVFIGLQFIQAQSVGMIEYAESMKLEIKFDDMPEDMKSMIPETHSLQKVLLFEKDKSVYTTKKGEEIEDVDMESDDGSFKIQFKMDDQVEDIFFKDFSTKEISHQKGIMGKPFIVENAMETFKWKLTGEKIKYLGYECQKAVIENDEDFIIAWFTSSIPVQIGPDEYHGLPGAILMLSINDGKKEYKATDVKLDYEHEGTIAKPKGHKVVDEETFNKIQEEKKAELIKMYSSKKQH